jgi:hypothetical protein
MILFVVTSQPYATWIPALADSAGMANKLTETAESKFVGVNDGAKLVQNS